MSPEIECADARVELSARLDGEVDEATSRSLDAHVRSCASCRAHEHAISRVRRTLRARPAEPVPDLSDAILAAVRLAEDPPRGASLPSSHKTWGARLRVAGIAAAAAALVMLGASLPFVETPPDLAAAGEIAARVRAAARDLHSYRATFEILERGWHPDVPVRHLTATVSFRAPERFRLQVRDRTVYPSGGRWPRNDVEIIANARRWWIREPSSCPRGGMPQCAVGVETRSIVRRQPFDSTSSLPTDIIVPLETLASSGDFEVVGTERFLGRSAYRVALPYRRAVPLVLALEGGGVWRDFQPFDRVEVWIDRKTWFPLRFEVVRAGRSPLLSVRATSFTETPEFGPRAFAAPRRGIVKDGGFRPSRRLRSPRPGFVAGLRRYREGVLAGGQEIRTYADGMTWLKITYDRGRPAAFLTTAEQIRLGPSDFAYYQPAAGSSAQEAFDRRVDLFGARVHVHLESNLARAELLRVARSLPLRARRLPDSVRRGGVSVKRITPAGAARLGFVRAPTFLPSGYRASAAFLSRSRDGRRTVTVYYRRAEAEFDGFGIRITQARPVGMLPPTSESLHSFRVDGRHVRWSEQRGEAEWRDGATYRAVAVPSFGWTTAARIIEGLR